MGSDGQSPSTPDAITVRLRTIALEAAVGVGFVLAVVAALKTPHLGVGVLRPHPIWIAILVVAARYGAKGFLVASVLGWGALAACGLLFRWTTGLVADTLASPTELGALTAAVLVAWVAAAHERRAQATEAKLASAEHRSAADGAALTELRKAALSLRARNDRLDLSLTFLKDVAGRLDGADPESAGEAALDLVIARLGARAAAVLVTSQPDESGREGAGGLVTFLARGLWRSDGGDGVDTTTAEVLRTGRPLRAVDLPNAGPGDSDLAAPIRDRSGALRGVLAARGMVRGGAGLAALRDLAVVAEWCGRAFSGPVASDESEGRGGADRDGAAPYPADV